MAKRNRETSELADLHILVHGRDDPLNAHRDMLKYNSGVVSDLPASVSGGPMVWDLRQVVLEGEASAVDAAVVQTWLDHIYSRVDATRSCSLSSSLQECVRLLKFADFADTCQPALDDLASRIAHDPGAYLDATVSEKHKPRMLLHDSAYFDASRGLTEVSLANVRPTVLVPTALYGADVHARFRAALSAAVEAALYLAARMELLPLIRVLRSFIKAQLLPFPQDAVLDFGVIYSPRVLQSLPREVLFEGFLNDSFTDHTPRVELTIDTDHDESSEVVVFRSKLAARWFQQPVGEPMKGVLSSGQLGDEGYGLYNANSRGDVFEARLNAVVGGFRVEEREALVRKGLAKVAGGGRGGPAGGASS